MKTITTTTIIPFDIASYMETLKTRISNLKASIGYMGGTPAVYNSTRATIKCLEEVIKDMQALQAKDDEANGIVRIAQPTALAFTYKGHKFVGIRGFSDEENERSMKEIMWCCNTQKKVFPLDNDRVQLVYNHTGFYRAAKKAGYGVYDLFRCEGMILMPGNNELFQYDENK